MLSGRRGVHGPAPAQDIDHQLLPRGGLFGSREVWLWVFRGGRSGVSRPCSVCVHPARSSIDSALIRRVSYRHLAGRYSLSESAISRHLNDHVAEYVQKALSEYGDDKGVKVLAKLSSMIDRLNAFLDKAEADENALEFRAVASEWRKQLELIAKLQGELAQESTVTIINNPEWVELRTVIVGALDAHPDARESVLRAIRSAGNGSL